MKTKASSLAVLNEALQACTACPLYAAATQAVPGEGPARPRVLVAGEQPGDVEDRSGRPFTGPAGLLLNRALEDAGVDRSQVYVTNAVKHFKFEQRGKRRIHQKPNASEIEACHPWLSAEIDAIKPALLVCLGATAARSVMGRPVKVMTERGHFLPHADGREVFITVHPSALLRMQDAAEKEAEYRRFVADWKMVGARLRS
jgi:uracil-DNA glycosylase